MRLSLFMSGVNRLRECDDVERAERSATVVDHDHALMPLGDERIKGFAQARGDSDRRQPVTRCRHGLQLSVADALERKTPQRALVAEERLDERIRRRAED